MRLINPDAFMRRLREACKDKVTRMIVDKICVFVEVEATFHPVEAEPVIRCKDCEYFANIRLKQDGTEDNRYKPDYCEYHRGYTRENYFCSNAIGVKETK